MARSFREWVRISRSTSSSSCTPRRTATGRPLRVTTTAPFSLSLMYAAEIRLDVRDRCDLHSSTSSPPMKRRSFCFTPMARISTSRSSSERVEDLNRLSGPNRISQSASRSGCSTAFGCGSRDRARIQLLLDHVESRNGSPLDGPRCSTVARAYFRIRMRAIMIRIMTLIRCSSKAIRQARAKSAREEPHSQPGAYSPGRDAVATWRFEPTTVHRPCAAGGRRTTCDGGR